MESFRHCWRDFLLQTEMANKLFYQALTYEASLTCWLNHHYKSDIRVTVHFNGFEYPAIDEARYLSRMLKGRQDRRLVWCREVSLSCPKGVLVVARTLLPLPFLPAITHRVSTLGGQSLGKFLFSQPDLVYTPFQYMLLKERVEPFSRVMAPIDAQASAYWCRRRLFTLRNYAFSVMEIFNLP
jgi:chorismate-pyruvate lyase